MLFSSGYICFSSEGRPNAASLFFLCENICVNEKRFVISLHDKSKPMARGLRLPKRRRRPGTTRPARPSRRSIRTTKRQMKMSKPICVRSSVHVKPTSDFNAWQEEMAEERRFQLKMEQFKADLIAAYTNRNK